MPLVRDWHFLIKFDGKSGGSTLTKLAAIRNEGPSPNPDGMEESAGVSLVFA
jgi:hypothetical protein